MELAVHGGDQDDIEYLERVFVGCRVSARGEEVEVVDALFADTKVTADSDGFRECGSGEDEKDGQKRKREKERVEHCAH
jgi:hypothetical protein